jgi:hypothetical protein
MGALNAYLSSGFAGGCCKCCWFTVSLGDGG